MLLIDASQISLGGGKVLLDYLIKKLQEKGLQFCLIKNNNYSFDDESIEIYTLTNFFNRNKVYRQILSKHSIKSVLCFSSVPPPFKLENIQTFTYFHAPNLLSKANLDGYTLKYKLMRFFKMLYNKLHFKNTQYILTQTNHIDKAIINTYGIAKDRCIGVPFYDEESMIKIVQRNKANVKKYDFSYISFASPHKNHKNLLEAWKILSQKNINPSLVITAPDIPVGCEFVKYVDSLIREGVNIINIGKVPFEEAIRYTSESRFTIYPSVNETLGLGYVEAYYAGQKVLASDLEIAHDVIKPSLTFDPFSPEDIAAKVEFALNNELPPTELKLKNEVDKLIKLLTTNE